MTLLLENLVNGLAKKNGKECAPVTALIANLSPAVMYWAFPEWYMAISAACEAAH